MAFKHLCYIINIAIHNCPTIINFIMFAHLPYCIDRFSLVSMHVLSILSIKRCWDIHIRIKVSAVVFRCGAAFISQLWNKNFRHFNIFNQFSIPGLVNVICNITVLFLNLFTHLILLGVIPCFVLYQSFVTFQVQINLPPYILQRRLHRRYELLWIPIFIG